MSKARPDDDLWGAPAAAAPKAHVIGEPLEQLSIDELDDRIAALRDEISRLETKRQEKDASRQAADSFFKR